MLINEFKAIHILSFWSLCKFTNKLPFLWHLLHRKLPKMGRKLKQSLEVPILTRELYVFTRKDLCFGMCWQVVHKMFMSEFSIRSSSKKWYIYLWLYLTQIIHWNSKMLFAWWKIVYQSFYCSPLMFSYFLLQEKFCVSHTLASCLRDVDCLESVP